ncbi:hypothetical protein E4U58_004883 [Claviceps cyperi]|nr:hypothetical protein E4U58_004883 [Claviceps cyperi]
MTDYPAASGSNLDNVPGYNNSRQGASSWKLSCRSSGTISRILLPMLSEVTSGLEQGGQEGIHELYQIHSKAMSWRAPFVFMPVPVSPVTALDKIPVQFKKVSQEDDALHFSDVLSSVCTTNGCQQMTTQATLCSAFLLSPFHFRSHAPMRISENLKQLPPLAHGPIVA